MLGTIPTRESFLDVVLFVVAFQREFSLESLLALVDVAHENLLRLLVRLFPVQERALWSCRSIL